MIRLLSTPRLRTYSNACNSSIPDGLELYRWNLDVSMAFFESIHYFEVGFRNTVDTAMTKWFDATHPTPNGALQPHWFDPDTVHVAGRTPGQLSGLNNNSLQKVRDATRNAGRRHSSVKPGHVVAELSLGFWHYLLKPSGTNAMWTDALRHAFVRTARQQRLEASVGQIVELRNRIAHHEPIFAIDLHREYENLIRSAEIIEPGLGWWIDSTSRVDSVLRRRPAD
ncbi:Abi family protein [Millisia brevis]|uniref:Abi family protein n=1 Tax=Millisia brevis TaxID=264148 RepID=UPI0014722AB7|nr:Abi family protein [Millisia brevis]